MEKTKREKREEDGCAAKRRRRNGFIWKTIYFLPVLRLYGVPKKNTKTER